MSVVRSLALAVCLAGSACAATRVGEPPTVAADSIPGVVAEGAAWSLVWAGTETADGLVAARDGGLWFAQEQTSSIIAIDADDGASVYMTDTRGAGALSVSRAGALFAVERTCTDPGLHDPDCAVPTAVAVFEPQRRILADAFADGRRLGRLNDIAADSRGGAYFTVGGAYYAAPDGAVTTVIEGEGVRTNGVVLSPDEKVLYVTNGPAVLAFDVAPDGSTSNRRIFAMLDEGDAGDGMAVDADGRLYVTGVTLRSFVYVFDAAGVRLGVIPTPRQPVSIAFAGPGKRTLYLSGMGAVIEGREHEVPEGVRNTAMTVYRLETVTAGPPGRAK